MIEEYAAGIVDGEGSIGIASRNGQSSFHLCMQVSMKLPTVIPKWLYKNFGGNYGEYRQSKNAYGDGIIAKWSIHGVEAQAVIRCIMPYLKDKYKLAELALLFPISSDHHHVDKESQESIYWLIKSIKGGLK